MVNDLREAGLNTGDYILISTDTRLAIERGTIVDIDEQNVKVATNRYSSFIERKLTYTSTLDLFAMYYFTLKM